MNETSERRYLEDALDKMVEARDTIEHIGGHSEILDSLSDAIDELAQELDIVIWS